MWTSRQICVYVYMSQKGVVSSVPYVHVCTALVFVLHWWRDCTYSSPFACWHFIHCDHVTFKSLSDMHEHRAPWFHGQFSPEAMLSTCHPDHEWWWKFVARCRSWCKPVESVIEFCPPVHPLFCSLAVLNPRVGHTMDVLSPFISVLCHSDWLFHGQSCPRFDVVHPGRAWSSSPACTCIVPCIISFSRQLPCFLMLASLLWQCLTVPSLLQLC